MVAEEASLLCGLTMLMDARLLGPEGPLPILNEKGASVLGLEEVPLEAMGWPMRESLGKGSPYRRSRAKENTVLSPFPSPPPLALLPAIEGPEKPCSSFICLVHDKHSLHVPNGQHGAGEGGRGPT